MLYLNKAKKIEERMVGDYTVKGVTLGEFGRGRREVFLSTNLTIEKIQKGLNTDLSIGKTRSGRPKLIEEKDGKLYLILNSSNGYTRRGCGFQNVREEDKERITVIARSNGADGDAGGIGSWDENLVEILGKESLVIRNKRSGGGTSQIIRIDWDNNPNPVINEFENIEDYLLWCDAKDTEILFDLEKRDNGFVFNNDSFVKI